MSLIEPAPAASIVMKKLSARPYQRRVVNDTYATIKRGIRRVLIVAATGSGKTVMATMMVQDAVRMGCQVLFVVDRDELVGQTLRTFGRYLGSVRQGVVKAGMDEHEDRGATVQVASRQTMERRSWWREWLRRKPTVIIIDEAHEVAFAEVIRAIVEEYAPGQTPRTPGIVLGLTATPWRLSKREGLGDLFEELVAAPTLADLIEMGYLLRPIYHGMHEVNLEGVQITRRGDFDERQLARVCNRPEAIADIFRNWMAISPGLRTIGFCVDKEHARSMAEYWNAQGQPATWVQAETTSDERRVIYRQQRDGTVPTIFSVGVLIKGFDESSIECIILARPTASVANVHQMVGRGLRVHRPCLSCGETVPVDQEDPDAPTCGACATLQPEEHILTWPTACHVLDPAGNIGRLGPPDMLSKYTMSKGSGGAPGPAPTKRCPRCKVLHHLSAPTCAPERGGCGYVWPVAVKPAAVGTLRRIRAEDAAREWYRRAAQEAFDLRYSPNYAREKYKRTYGDYPPDSFILGSVFPEATHVNMTRYLGYLKEVARAKLAKGRKKKDEDFEPYAWVQWWFRAQFDREVRWTRLEAGAVVDARPTSGYAEGLSATMTLDEGRAGA